MSLLPWKNKERRMSSESRGYSPAVALRNEMDQLFDRFFSSQWSNDLFNGESGFGSSWAPSVDVSENDKEVTVYLELPGIEPDDINLSLTGNLLTVSGEKKEEVEEKAESFVRTERYVGSFRRAVELPASIDVNNVHADYKKGVLTVRVAKLKGMEPRKIPIVAGSAG